MDEKSAAWFKRKRQQVEEFEYNVGEREGEIVLMPWEDLEDYYDSNYFLFKGLFRTYRNGLGLPKNEVNKNYFWVIEIINLFTEEDTIEENYQAKQNQKKK